MKKFRSNMYFGPVHLQGDDSAVCVQYETGKLHRGHVDERASDAGPRAMASVHGFHPQLDNTGRCLPHVLELRQDSSCVFPPKLGLVWHPYCLNL